MLFVRDIVQIKTEWSCNLPAASAILAQITTIVAKLMCLPANRLPARCQQLCYQPATSSTMILTGNSVPQFERLPLVAMVLTLCIKSTCSFTPPPIVNLPQTGSPAQTMERNSNLVVDDFQYYTDIGAMASPVLTAKGGSSMDILMDSRSTFAVNLNQALAEDISVELKVYSAPQLITFYKSKEVSMGENVISQSVYVTYKANNYGDRVVGFKTGAAAGHAGVVCKVVKQPSGIGIDDSEAYSSISVYKSRELAVLSSVVGWLYYLACSMSLCSQVYLNYQRKSVVGLNFDFLALNLMGFTYYLIYNFSLTFVKDVRRDYYERHLYSRIPVETNDLVFAIQAFVLALILVVQCFMYERGHQTVSTFARCFVGGAAALGVGLSIVSIYQRVHMIGVVIYLAYAKLAATLIKYAPQAYFNYQRQATTGWSIHSVLLNLIGSILSLMQMFLLALNFDDWSSIFGNFSKFGLGIISIAFDICFVTQHYVLYEQVRQFGAQTETALEPVQFPSVKSTN